LLLQRLQGKPVDLVISDMAPNMSGVASVDQARSMNLAELALEFSDKSLKPGGSLLIKTFQGAGFNEFYAQLRHRFEKLATRKPSASRAESKEIYLLGRGFRGV
jgi:23S rRNA (uridine2552-2'-O)-methyltransferase